MLDNIVKRFGSKLYRQIVDNPMGTNCAPLVADLFCFVMRETSCCLCQTIEHILLNLYSPSRYLDDLLDIDNPYFEQIVGHILYTTKLQLNEANSSDTEAQSLDLDLSITNGIVSSKIYDKRDDFNFEIVNLPVLDGALLRSPRYGVVVFFAAYSSCESAF